MLFPRTTNYFNLWPKGGWLRCCHLIVASSLKGKSCRHGSFQNGWREVSSENRFPKPMIVERHKPPARLVVLFELQSRIVLDFSKPFSLRRRAVESNFFRRLDSVQLHSGLTLARETSAWQCINKQQAFIISAFFVQSRLESFELKVSRTAHLIGIGTKD